MKLSLKDIKVGMSIGQDLYSENGQLITPTDTIVTEELLNKLKRFKIKQIEMIHENLDENIFDVKNTTAFKSFQNKCEEAKESLTSSIDGILREEAENSHIDIIQSLGSVLYESNKTNLNLIDMIYTMHEHSDSVYTHSVNVGMIASHLGRWLRFPEEDIKLLVTCGLFHDIGKLLIPKEILEKPEKLTSSEYKIIQTHTTKGFELLNKFNAIDDRVKKVALLHHERCDGTGYPMHFHGEQIDKFSKIIAIADTYEAMISKRAYREPICPFTVVNDFEKDGLHKFETKYVLKFLDKILNSYLHTKVLLSNGQEAIVIMINKKDKSKPLVKTNSGEFLDLSINPKIKIVKMIS